MAIKKHRGQKAREQSLIRHLVDGLAGWLTFRQAGGARTLYSEHFLYPPIYEIASGLAWSVLAQEPINSVVGKDGPPRTLDFVFVEKEQFARKGSRGLIMMEIKYLRGENTTQELFGLQEDFAKLRSAGPDELRHSKVFAKCGSAGKWQILVAQRKPFDRLSRCRSKKYSEIVKLLASTSSDNRPRLIYKSVIETKLKADFHWHVLAIGEERWPSSDR